jgi:hypothetical protein
MTTYAIRVGTPREIRISAHWLVATVAALVGVVVWLGAAPPGYADTFQTLYGTELGSGGGNASIVKITVDLTNLNNSSATTLYTATNSSSDFDSLVLNSTNNPTAIYFDDYALGTVNKLTNLGGPAVNTVLGTVSGGVNAGPADMVVEQGGSTMLVSEFGNPAGTTGGQIDRVNITGGSPFTATVVTGLVKNGPEGLVIASNVSATNFFAAVGLRGSPGTNGFKAINEYTSAGALVTSFTNPNGVGSSTSNPSSTPGFNSMDSMIYDPADGLIWGTSHYGQGIYSIDPTAANGAAGSIHFYSLIGSGVTPLTVNGQDAIDGITVDANGNLYIVEQNVGPLSGGQPTYGDVSQNRIDIFNIGTSTWSTATNSALTENGLDDLAPASFSTTIPDNPVPEPLSAGLSLMGMSSLALVALRRRRA